jgi:hypothetical protein
MLVFPELTVPSIESKLLFIAVPEVVPEPESIKLL